MRRHKLCSVRGALTAVSRDASNAHAHLRCLQRGREVSDRSKAQALQSEGRDQIEATAPGSPEACPWPCFLNSRIALSQQFAPRNLRRLYFPRFDCGLPARCRSGSRRRAQTGGTRGGGALEPSGTHGTRIGRRNAGPRAPETVGVHQALHVEVLLNGGRGSPARGSARVAVRRRRMHVQQTLAVCAMCGVQCDMQEAVCVCKCTVFVCVCVYVCMCVYVYIHIYIYIYISVHERYIYICIYIEREIHRYM